jgi:hypothetical protein
MTARTHCPECNSHAVIDLADVIDDREVDFFWCGKCRSMWHLAKDTNWPPSTALLEPRRLPAQRTRPIRTHRSVPTAASAPDDVAGRHHTAKLSAF